MGGPVGYTQGDPGCFFFFGRTLEVSSRGSPGGPQGVPRGPGGRGDPGRSGSKMKKVQILGTKPIWTGTSSTFFFYKGVLLVGAWEMPQK